MGRAIWISACYNRVHRRSWQHMEISYNLCEEWRRGVSYPIHVFPDHLWWSPLLSGSLPRTVHRKKCRVGVWAMSSFQRLVLSLMGGGVGVLPFSVFVFLRFSFKFNTRRLFLIRKSIWAEIIGFLYISHIHVHKNHEIRLCSSLVGLYV